MRTRKNRVAAGTDGESVVANQGKNRFFFGRASRLQRMRVARRMDARMNERTAAAAAGSGSGAAHALDLVDGEILAVDRKHRRILGEVDRFDDAGDER